MSDHAKVMAGPGNWAVLLPDVLVHIVDQMNELLPESLALMTDGARILLSHGSGPPRIVATESLTLPAEVDRSGLATVAGHMLGDVQDLVVTHLGTPWPMSGAGLATHASASLKGTVLQLGFEPRSEGAGDSIALQPYPLPDRLPEVKISG